MAGPGGHGDALLDLLEPAPEIDDRYAAIAKCCQYLRVGYGRVSSRSRSRSRSRSPRRAWSSVRDRTLRRHMMSQVTEGAISQLNLLDHRHPEIVMQLESDPRTSPDYILVDPIEVEEFFDVAYQHCAHIIDSMTREKFYIGICCSPKQRLTVRGMGHRESWHEMNLLLVTTGDVAARLEMALIHEYKKYPTCSNIGA